MIRRSSRSIRIFFNFNVAIFALLLAFTPGCSKKEDTETKSAVSNSLLPALPPTTAGFYSFRTDLEGYQTLRAQNWSSWSESLLKDIDQQLTSLDPPNGQAIGSLVSLVKQSGLIPDSPDKPDGIKEGLFFVTTEPETHTLGGGLYLTTMPSVNCTDLVEKMIPHLRNAQMTVARETVGTNILLAIGAKDASGTDRTIYLLASRDRMALSPVRSLAERLFANPADNGFTVISSTPDYLKSFAEVTQAGEQFGFGYVDLQRLKNYAATLPDFTSHEELKDLPFTGAAISQAIRAGVATRFAVSIAPANDQQKLLVTNLERMPENVLATRVPADSVLYFGVDGQLIKTIQEGAISELSPEQRQAAEPWLASVRSLKGVGITLRKNAGDSPFPDLILTAQSSDANALLGSLKNEVTAVSESQMPAGRWLEKEILGTKVSYLLTPLGIGIYFGAVNDTVVGATTESAITSALRSLADPKEALVARLDDNVRAALTSSSSLLNGYADFAALADLIESVQGSLALFTGGANPVNASQIQGLKRMGIGAGSLKVSQSFLKGEIHVKPQEKERSR